MIKVFCCDDIWIYDTQINKRILIKKGVYYFDEETRYLYSLNKIIIGIITHDRLWNFITFSKFRENRIDEILQD